MKNKVKKSAQYLFQLGRYQTELLVIVKVGNEKGMTVFLESGQYNLECRGKSKGLFTPSNNWKKTITIEPNQEFHQKFSCLKQYD